MTHPLLLFIYPFLYFWLHPGSSWLHAVFCPCSEQGLLSSRLVLSSLVTEHSSRRSGFSSPALGLSSSEACGIFPAQGSDPWPLHERKILYHWTSQEVRLLLFLNAVLLAYFRDTMVICSWGFPGDLVVENMPANAGDEGDLGSIPGLGRYPVVGNGSLLPCSCLKNSVDRGAWRATVRGVAESDRTERTHTQC